MQFHFAGVKIVPPIHAGRILLKDGRILKTSHCISFCLPNKVRTLLLTHLQEGTAEGWGVTEYLEAQQSTPTRDTQEVRWHVPEGTPPPRSSSDTIHPNCVAQLRTTTESRKLAITRCLAFPTQPPPTNPGPSETTATGLPPAGERKTLG